MRGLAWTVVVAVALASSCKNEPSQPAQGSAARHSSSKDDEVRKILVLEGAAERVKAELSVLEAATPRDEAAIAAKRDALDAVTRTLANARRHFNEMDRRARGSN